METKDYVYTCGGCGRHVDKAEVVICVDIPFCKECADKEPHSKIAERPDTAALDDIWVDTMYDYQNDKLTREQVARRFASALPKRAANSVTDAIAAIEQKYAAYISNEEVISMRREIRKVLQQPR